MALPVQLHHMPRHSPTARPLRRRVLAEAGDMQVVLHSVGLRAGGCDLVLDIGTGGGLRQAVAYAADRLRGADARDVLPGLRIRMTVDGSEFQLPLLRGVETRAAGTATRLVRVDRPGHGRCYLGFRLEGRLAGEIRLTVDAPHRQLGGGIVFDAGELTGVATGPVRQRKGSVASGKLNGVAEPYSPARVLPGPGLRAALEVRTFRVTGLPASATPRVSRT